LAELGVESHLDRKMILAWVFERKVDAVVGVIAAAEPVVMNEPVQIAESGQLRRPSEIALDHDCLVSEVCQANPSLDKRCPWRIIDFAR